jgi:dTDP-4-amino-4,6-dideoxygalactose transaminase
VPAAHILPVLLPPGVPREAFMEHMKQQGIQTSVHYPPVHRFSAYAEAHRGVVLPLTEAVGAREVTLPLYPGLTEAQVEQVATAAAQAMRVAGAAQPELAR